MNPDGSGLRLLAREVGLGEMAWSPDGREILYGGLSVVKADGSGERRLSDEAYGFGWAPDGQQIAFTTVRGGYRDIYVVNSDGSGQRRIVKRGAYPSWSPDGRQIVFTSRRDGNWEIYVVNADGGGERKLTRNPGSDGSGLVSGRADDRLRALTRPRAAGHLRDERRRQWTAEMGAQRLAGLVAGRPEDRLPAWLSEIYVMNADGSGQRRLVRGGYGPVWSPDGRRIVYVRGQGPPLGKPDIYVMNADGSGQRRLLHTYVDSLAWSPAQR